MPIPFSSLISSLKDFAPGLLAIFGSPASPGIGDTDWSGVNATGATLNELTNMTNGQLIIGKTADAGLSNPTTAPVLTTSTTGGTLLAGVYEVVRTYKNTYGETQASSTGTITIPAGTTTNKINVAAITLPTGALSQNVYVSDAAGSITMRFSTNTSGSAFSINNLPAGGAVIPPTSNTTGSDNHAVKATIATTNGLVVTNGPGSIDISLSNAGDLTSAGTAITVAKVNGVAVTGTPATGDVITATGTTAAHWATPSLGTLTSAHIYVGNGSNVATNVAMSGDATIANTGAVTVGKVNGIAVTGTPSTGQVITATGTTAATWQTPSGGGGGGISSGTSFPGSPATNDLFFRTDRGILFFWNGTNWLSVTKYHYALASRNGAQPFSSAGPNYFDCVMPDIGVSGVVVTDFVVKFMAATVSQSGSNYISWQGFSNKAAAAFDTLTPLVGNSQTATATPGATWYIFANTGLSQVLTTSDFDVQINISTTGSPGTYYMAIGLAYRIKG